MSTVVKDLGAVSAYAYAVEKGYTGTEEEFAELMADYAEVGQRAEDAADSALESKTAAQTAATTATNKASEATTAATTATTKAGEASTSASTATSAKDTAVSASQTATSKANEATTAAATATSAKTDAVAANTAAQSAKTAAQTAQTGAETAAASVEASAEQIATNAEDISQLKSDLNFKITKGVYTEQIPFTLIKGKYLLQDGTEASNNNYAIVEANLTDISGCLRICSYAGSGNARYAFYDVGGNAIEIKTQSGSSTKAIEDVKIPENAVKIKASGSINILSLLPRVSLVKYDEYLSNSNGGFFTDLLVPNEFEDVAYSWSSGGFYYTNNTFVENEAAHFMSINVVEGEFYRITGNSYYSNNIYGFVNSNNVITWFPNASNAKSYDEIVRIPNDTVAMIVQGKASDTTTIKKATGYADGRIFLGKKIAVIGDSTVEKNATAAMKWHDNIALETGLEVVNLGVSGTGYKRGEENNKAYYHRLSSIPSDCDAVVFFGSGNDNEQTVGTITDTTTDTVCGCVNKTINDLIALYPTMKIGVITAYPWRSFKPSTTNAMQTIANDIVEICRGNSIPVLDLYHCSNLRPWIPENESALFANADGVHINDAGHAIVTPMILEFLKKLLPSY